MGETQVMSVNSIYDKLSEERKAAQEAGTMPIWFTTGGWQLFKEKYLFEAKTVREQYQRIAYTAAKHMASVGKEAEANYWFFKLLWDGWLSPSTPVLANMGTSRGMPVSCAGNDIDDSVDGFYSARRETAILTKNSFGTSSNLSHIRARGTPYSAGGKASGIMPVFKGHIQDMRDIAQGSRRGAWAGYLDVEHGDFDELVDFVMAETDDANVGWIIKNSFIKKLESGDAEANRRHKRYMKLKMITGKGYFFFVDKVNANRPECYKHYGLHVSHSNLCSEITLFDDNDHTFTCVLSSMNLSKWDEWKDTDAVYWATIFLDCVAQEFIDKAKNVPGLEKAVRATIKGRALGLGAAGFHTLLQSKMIPFESFAAFEINDEIFKHIDENSLRASQYLAKVLGEPEWCKGFGIRNTHRIAIAPTKSTALIMGGISEGINPDPAMAFTQTGAGGEIDRLNPILLKYMKENGLYIPAHVKEIIDAFGSVQDVTWLSDAVKEVFKTAFEINQEALIAMASARAPYICQWQSLNLFFSANESEEWIQHIMEIAFRDPSILALYYFYSVAGIRASSGECVSCQ